MWGQPPSPGPDFGRSGWSAVQSSNARLSANCSALCCADSLITFVFFFRPCGQQHPQRVHSQRRTKWNVNQSQEAKNQSQQPGPRLTVQQPPSRDETSGCFCENKKTDGGQQRMQERGRGCRRTHI